MTFVISVSVGRSRSCEKDCPVYDFSEKDSYPVYDFPEKDSYPIYDFPEKDLLLYSLYDK